MDNKKPKLHIACGEQKLPGWINIDIDSKVADLHLDLTQGLPFENSSVQYIYCEHFIEHVARPEAINILKECYRVLSDDGVLRLSTPDLTFLVTAYLSENTSEWGTIWQPSNSCHLINEGMRSWGHQFLYNSHELSLALLESGFAAKKYVTWGNSTFQEFKNIESRPFHGELIVEAYKSSLSLPKEEEEEHCSPQETDSESNSIEVIRRLKQRINESVYNSEYVKDLEHKLANTVNHLTWLQKIAEEQSKHIKNQSDELLIRGQYIRELESTLDKIKNFMIFRVLRVFYRDLYK